MSTKTQVPLATCFRERCEGCGLRDRLLCVADFLPINRVPPEIRERFFGTPPAFAAARKR